MWEIHTIMNYGSNSQLGYSSSSQVIRFNRKTGKAYLLVGNEWQLIKG